MAFGDLQDSNKREAHNPAFGAFEIDPDDDVTYDLGTTGLYVGGAGNITVRMLNGEDTVLFSNIAPGTILPIRVTRVYATGTTATLIVGLYV